MAPGYRLMTDGERDTILMMQPYAPVVYPPGSFDKRFIRDLAYQAQADEPTITEKQSAYLRKIAYRYRKQQPRAQILLDMVDGTQLPLRAEPLEAV